MDKSFVPDVKWMKEKYDEMNATLFNGRLGECMFGIFTTGKGSGGNTLGWFRITGRDVKINRRTGRIFVEEFFDRVYVDRSNFAEMCEPKIELNGNYHGTEHGFLSTLVHEMCHYYTYMDGWAPKQAHGREFREIGELVSSRSKGMFTVQRLADAEQMSEFELNDEMKARREKRLANKKASIFAVFDFTENGEIKLTTTSDEKLINRIKTYLINKGDSVVINNDINVIEFLFSKGYKRNFRTWRYWFIQNEPWIEQLKGLLVNGNNNQDNVIQPPINNTPKKTFVIKTTNGLFKYEFSSEDELVNAIKQRFPNMSDETIYKVVKNPANYQVNEKKKTMKDIISEVIDEFIANENIKNNVMDDSIDITPDMNLGKYSPLQL